jgi:hypothetical protein
MKQQNSLTTHIINRPSLSIRMLIGAAIGLGFITLFLSTAGPGDPSWPKFWMLRPLVIVPLAGAMGGLCFYIIDIMRHRYGWNKWLAYFASLLIFIVGLFMGIVLGLDGTFWN